MNWPDPSPQGMEMGSKKRKLAVVTTLAVAHTLPEKEVDILPHAYLQNQERNSGNGSFLYFNSL
jgi:hypothetical protein